MIIEFDVKNQTLSKETFEKVVAQSKNYLKLKFNFNNDWQTLTKAVLFETDYLSEPVITKVDENDSCNVPNSVTERGICRISIIGGAEDDIKNIMTNDNVVISGILITTNPIEIEFTETLNLDNVVEETRRAECNILAQQIVDGEI